VLAQIEGLESNNKLLQKEIEEVRKEVENERELRELAVKAAQA